MSSNNMEHTAWLQTFLDEMGIEYEAMEDEEGREAFLMNYGEAGVMLAAGHEEQLGDYVDIKIILVVDVPALDKKTARYLLEMSHDCTFGGFYYDEELGHVGYFYRLLAHLMDASVLAIVINEVGQIAEAESEGLAERTGGSSLLGRSSGYPDIDGYIEEGKSAKKLWKMLEEEIGEELYYDEDEEAYYAEVGSTTMYVHVYEIEEFPVRIVECYATVTEEVDALPLEAALLMLRENRRTTLGTFCYEKEWNYVYLSHIVPGDVVDGDVLNLMMALVGETADKWDKKIAKLIEG